MFSKTCEYAIRAMIFIAKKSKSGGRAGIREISAEIGSPVHFIAKILQELVRKTDLKSAKGPNGGFYLEESSLNYSIADIVRVIDGDRLFNGCGLGLDYCSEDQPCPIHHEFKAIRNEIYAMLESATLTEFTGALENKITFLKR